VAQWGFAGVEMAKLSQRLTTVCDEDSPLRRKARGVWPPDRKAFLLRLRDVTARSTTFMRGDGIRLRAGPKIASCVQRSKEPQAPTGITAREPLSHQVCVDGTGFRVEGHKRHIRARGMHNPKRRLSEMAFHHITTCLMAWAIPEPTAMDLSSAAIGVDQLRKSSGRRIGSTSNLFRGQYDFGYICAVGDMLRTGRVARSCAKDVAGFLGASRDLQMVGSMFERSLSEAFISADCAREPISLGQEAVKACLLACGRSPCFAW